MSVKKDAKGRKIKDVKRIRVKRIYPDVIGQKGFFGEGCYGCDCADICCEYGCDVDYATLKLMHRYRDRIEPLVGRKLEECFSTELKADDDYIGGAYRETAVRESEERCVFHLEGKKGCALFHLWAKEGLPKRIVPTICRTYPITWHRGDLFVDRPLRWKCQIRERRPRGERIPSLFETQKREINALFEIDEKALERIERLKSTKPPAGRKRR